MQLGAVATTPRRPDRQPGDGRPRRHSRPDQGAARSATLRRLRLPLEERPLVDPGLAGGLRAWLEDGLWPLVGSVPPGRAAVQIDRRPPEIGPEEPGRRWEQADRRWEDAGRRWEQAQSTALEAMARALFRQLVTVGTIEDPFADSLAALEVDERLRDVARSVANLPAPHQAALRHDVVAQAANMTRQWQEIAPTWRPSTGERTRVRLAGGRVVLTGVTDLTLGRPSERRASVCLVDLRQGRPRPGHRTERRWAALLETLRAGAPPFRTATYYPAVDHLEAEDPTDSMLASAVHEVIAAVARHGATRRGAARRGVPSSPAATDAERSRGGEPGGHRGVAGARSTPGPDCAIALAPMLLPRARALTDALSAPGPAVAEPGGDPAVAASLAHRLSPLVSSVPYRPEIWRRSGTPGLTTKPVAVTVTSHLLRTALIAPQRLEEPDPFSWSPRTARRKIGLAAVDGCAAGAWGTPAEAVAATMRALVAQGRPERSRPGSLPAWLWALPEAGRVAVRAASTTWATRLWNALEWQRLDGATVGGPDAYWTVPASRQPTSGRAHRVAGGPALARRIVLRGRADVRADVAPGTGVLVTMAGGEPGPTARVELGLAALVAVLGSLGAPPARRRPAPVRVAGWWPDCGRAMVLPVDDDLLMETARAVVLAVERVVEAEGRRVANGPRARPAEEDRPARIAPGGGLA